MPEKMMLQLPVEPEKREEFLAAVNDVLPDTRAFEGNLKTELWVPEDDEGVVWIYEEWETRDNQEAYFNWRVEMGMMELIAPFLTGEPRVIWLQDR